MRPSRRWRSARCSTLSARATSARFFKLLASDTRLRMVHALAREGELNVTDLAQATGMSAQAVSNQLRRLVDRGIVAWRRDGASVRYRIVDPCVVSLLDLAWCISASGIQGQP